MYARKNAMKLLPLESEKVSFNYPTITPVSHMLLNYIAVDVDASANWIYYSDVRKDLIYRAHPDGTGKQSEIFPL